MRKLLLALVLTLFVSLIFVVPALASGGGVSETGLGRCALNPLHAPGSGAASHIWVPFNAWENANRGESGLHFMTAP